MMWVVPVRGQGSFSTGLAQPLFEDVYSGYNGVDYDVGRDGKFLMLKPATTPDDAGQINIIRNWTEELKARVPRP